MDSSLNPSMALYKREEKANFSCMNVVSCELTYEKYFSNLYIIFPCNFKNSDAYAFVSLTFPNYF